ncbi:hypothetical protein KJ671_02620 [Patescibacteria group bacterium]|nr:hypothetical protein [Patescibacteria group bacterium]
MNIDKLIKEVNNQNKNVENGDNKKEIPPVLRMDQLIDESSEKNIEETINELKDLLNKHEELKKELNDKIEWDNKMAKTKQENGNVEERHKAIEKLRLLAKIGRSINL